MASALAGSALADGGYYQGALGARAAGRGGAFVARADDVTAVNVNPAGLAQLDGTVIEIGDQAGYNGYDYTRAPTIDYGQSGTPLVSFDKVSNGAPWQPLLPFVGVASRLGLPNWSFALSAFAPPGISKLQFPESGGQRYLMVDREAIIIDYAASVAWKFRDLFGVGLTFAWITVPRLDYSLIINANTSPGASNPVSSNYDILAETKGSDLFTPNLIVGAWYRPRPSLQFGLAGQIFPASIVTHSTLNLTALDQALLGPITTSRNGGPPASDVSVTLPLPLLVRAGGRYRRMVGGRERYDLELDVEYETWSRAQNFTVGTNNLEAQALNQNVPLGTIEIAKHWNDTFSVKVGGDFNLVPDRWTLRAGAYYETAVAPASYANVDFPGGQELGAAVGASLLLRPLELALTYQLRYQPSFTVTEADARVEQQNPNFPGQPEPVVNAGTYAATSHLVALALIYRYGQ